MTALTMAAGGEGNGGFHGEAFGLTPYDVDAEKAVLGAMLTAKFAIDECADVVIPENFYYPKHELIFDAITFMHWNQQPVDAITVADYLSRKGDGLDKIGGQAYLHELAGSVVTAANATYYAGIVSDKAMQRRLIEASARIAQMAYQPGLSGGEVDDVVGAAQAEIDSVVRGQATELKDAASDIDALLEAVWTHKTLPSSPWPSYTRLIDGFEPGRVYTFAARPGGGKSISLIDICLWFLRKHKKAAAITSLEMSETEVIMRVLANMSNVEYGKIKNPDLMTAFQRDRVTEATQELKRLPKLWIDDRADQTVEMARSFARQCANRSDLGIYGLDYVQILRPSPGRKFSNREQEVAHMSRNIKMTAKALHLPVIMLAQLKRSDKKPVLSDLRESGSLENDSDVVTLFHREDDENGVPSTDLMGIVAKNRSGPMDAFNLYFDGPHMRFTEHDQMEGM